MTRLEMALAHLVAARKYTLALLEEVPPGDWFHMPAGVTHVAWQVGHIAMAEYRLLLERVRGVQAGDEKILPPEYLELFGRGSKPVPDAARYPTPTQLRSTLDRVHEAGLHALSLVKEEDLGLPPQTPHRIAHTRFEVLLWCGQHEMLHAGQIALLRRLHGLPPVW